MCMYYYWEYARSTEETVLCDAWFSTLADIRDDVASHPRRHDATDYVLCGLNSFAVKLEISLDEKLIFKIILTQTSRIKSYAHTRNIYII